MFGVGVGTDVSLSCLIWFDSVCVVALCVMLCFVEVCCVVVRVSLGGVFFASCVVVAFALLVVRRVSCWVTLFRVVLCCVALR